MHQLLLSFLSHHAIRVPSGAYELKQFCREFREFLPEAARTSWNRSRIVGELAKGGFPVGLQYGIAMVGGLAPKAQFREVDGRLELVNRG